MSYGYGGRANPYAQQDSPDGHYGSPNANPYTSPQMRSPPQANFGQPGARGYSNQDTYPARYGEGYENNVEMAPLRQNGANFAATSNPADILGECRRIDMEIDTIEKDLAELRTQRDRSFNDLDPNKSGISEVLDKLSAAIMTKIREVTQRVRELKSKPQTNVTSGQAARIEKRAKAVIQEYQQAEADFRGKMRNQLERQYRIVRPDADNKEVTAAVENMAGGGNVFQQAMMQSSKQGQAAQVLGAVQDRHLAMKNIAQQIAELQQLLLDLDNLIVQQGEQIDESEANAIDTADKLEVANEELDQAVETAKKTRKKKWICLGICVLIVVIIVVVVVVYFLVNKPTTSKNTGSSTTKRSLIEFVGESKIRVPGLEDTQDIRSFTPLSRFAGALRSSHGIAGRYVLPEDGLTSRSVQTLPVALGTDYTN